MAEPCSTGFLPSRHGFAFTNSWPPAPAVQIPTRLGTLGIGNAARGLCGGMVFAALDYWHAEIRPPAVQPAPGSALYRYVVRRLIESWSIPSGVARYYQWMNLPDGDGPVYVRGRRVLTRRGVSWRTIAVHWPRIRASLDHGTPTPLGLVTVASANPLQLGHNHQALAFGYALSGSEVILQVYDPNSGQDDGIAISFDASSPAQATTFRHNLNLARPVRGFFHAAYSPAVPPAL
jgi:hypothetical protein